MAAPDAVDGMEPEDVAAVAVAAGAHAALAAVRALKQAGDTGGDISVQVAVEPAAGLVVAFVGGGANWLTAGGTVLDLVRRELAGLNARVVEAPLAPLPLEEEEEMEEARAAEGAVAHRPAEGTLPRGSLSVAGPEALLVAAVRAAHAELNERLAKQLALAAR